MDWLIYIGILIVSSLISPALAPKPPKQKPYSLAELDVPTAELGRALPWVFGTRTIKDPNFVALFDFEARTRTKNKMKYRSYYGGFVVEVCVGPVDAVTRILYGDKVAWEGEVTASTRVLIEKSELFGGYKKGGGLAGYLNIQMGYAAQAVLSYLETTLGTPHTAYRDSLTLVGEHMLLVANEPYVRTITPTVRCILAGWVDDAPWYPEKAASGVSDGSLLSYDEYLQGVDGGPAVDYWWKLNTDFGAGNAANFGDAGTAALVLLGTKTSAQYNQAPLVLGTDDAGSLYRGGGYYNWLNAGSVSLGSVPFTAGVWFDLAGSSQQILFKSNVGGAQGHFRGLGIYAGGGTYLNIILGDGVGATSYRYKTPTGSITTTGTHFVAVYCEPAATVAGTVLKVYIDGGLQALTYESGSGVNVLWPTTPSDFDGWTGCGFGGNSDTYGLADAGYRDEPFVHIGEVTAAQVAEMYRRGLGAYGVVQDMNPAHIIYKALTTPDEGEGEPAANLDDASFRYAADTAYSEGLGFSFYWRNQGSMREFIQTVCEHAGFVRSIDPSTGKYTLIPLRDDYVLDDLDLITEAHVIEVIEWNDAADGEAVNEVTVIYRDALTNEDKPATWQNRASIAQQGVCSETRQYPGVSNYATAIRLAKRDVKQSSANLSKGKLKVNRSTWNKLPGAVFIFEHGPEQIDAIVVRVMEIDAGTALDSAMTITVMQSVSSLPLNVTEFVEEATRTVPLSTTPEPVTVQDALEIPYHWLRSALGDAEVATLADTEGFGRPLAKAPQSLATGYDVWGRISPADYADIADDQEFFGTATLSAALTKGGTTLSITGSTIDTGTVGAGDLIVVGTGSSAEWMRITGGDLTASITVDPAILDTTPHDHAIGARVWVMHPELDLWDETRYSDGDTVDYKMLTRTSSGVLEIASAAAVSATMDSRQARPYPPAGMTISGEGYPAALNGALTVEWVSRNRLTQYPAIVGQSEATVAAEAGTTYNAYAYDDDTDTLLDSATALAVMTWTPAILGPYNLRIEIESERDGYASWQRQVRVFEYIATDALTAESGAELTTEASDTLTTET